MSDRIDKSDQEWRAQLTDEQYRVTREKGTEPPFTGELVDCKDDGIYRCVCCENELFDSKTKYDSGSGWPSFFEALDDDRVRTELDQSHGMRRVEVLCGRCDAHLGHVFEDGPRPTGQRFCINSCALSFDERGDS